MNIIVKITGGDASSLNIKIESPNKTLANITRALLLKSSHKKEIWCFAYQYSIWISRRTENRFSGDVTYFLWHGIRSSYKHIKLWVVRVYIINGRATRKNLMIYHIGVILWDMQLLQELFFTGNQINHLSFTGPIMFGLMNIILAYP